MSFFEVVGREGGVWDRALGILINIACVPQNDYIVLLDIILIILLLYYSTNS